jgi:hypothetical protein
MPVRVELSADAFAATLDNTLLPIYLAPVEGSKVQAVSARSNQLNALRVVESQQSETEAEIKDHCILPEKAKDTKHSSPTFISVREHIDFISPAAAPAADHTSRAAKVS